MRFRPVFYFIFLVVIVQIIGLIWIYPSWQQFDVPMHFAGGVAMGLLALALWDHFVADIRTNNGLPGQALLVFFVLGFVALVGIGWEWFEFICDEVFTFVRVAIGQSQTSLGDTMADFALDLLGGLVVVVARLHNEQGRKV